MELPLYQVDAFTDRLFAGNPGRGLSAALLAQRRDDAIHRRGEQSGGDGLLPRRGRRLSPALVHAHAGDRPLRPCNLGECFRDFELSRADAAPDAFRDAQRAANGDPRGRFLLLDFPVWGLKPARNPAVGKAMGRDPSELFASIPYLAVYDSAAAVAALDPRPEGGRRP